MPEAVHAPSQLTERLYPPAISLREIWPYALLAVALVVQLYFVGADEGATSLVPGHVRARVRARRPPPARLPLPLSRG